MLTRLGESVRPWMARTPWTNVYGLGRTILALGTFLTLAASSTDILFRPALGQPEVPQCSGIAEAGIFCLLGDRLELARWIAMALLLVVASGWRPRVTGLVHWWVANSFAFSITIPDGGDHLTSLLTFLLLPLTLTDPRRWHWAPAEEAEAPASAARDTAKLFAFSGLAVVRLQMAGVYFHAAVAKFGVAEWADGTALYYWLNDPVFGAPHWARSWLGPVLENPLGVAAVTWGSMLTELALFLGLVLHRRFWKYLLPLGLVFHWVIAFSMGLFSFSTAMTGALILYLRPFDEEFAFARLPFRRRREAQETAAAPAAAPTA
ncbi:MAG TPA: sporulation-delaying protein SdpB family protein [Actinomycetota bacterium]|nr:sporulation-delaying protein SdpB family protein [Actinomycetota bacterium]